MNLNRVEILNQKQTVHNALYIMFKTFRINDNHALEYTKENSSRTSIVIYRQKEEATRNNLFFLEGIKGYEELLKQHSDQVHYINELNNTLIQLIQTHDLIVIDRAYLQEDILVLEQIREMALAADKTFAIVESNVVVPVRHASPKEEYSARTIRPKIWKVLDDYIDIDTAYDHLFPSEEKALYILDEFIKTTLNNYQDRNNPDMDYTSHLSAYLKYGFISPVTIYKKLMHSENHNTQGFLEELIIRRELAYNFVFYNKQYNQFKSITYGWAYQSMETHILDERMYHYTIEDYIDRNTHDEYFNAAMRQMITDGYMHGYMRMYWCKKIIEWSYNYEEAYHNAVYLNNLYFIDGNTPNGYTGIAWCFGKHDRAWPSRPIFGKLRYMNANGLKRKFNPIKYLKKYGGSKK